jgi:hypothetical protein
VVFDQEVCFFYQLQAEPLSESTPDNLGTYEFVPYKMNLGTADGSAGGAYGGVIKSRVICATTYEPSVV